MLDIGKIDVYYGEAQALHAVSLQVRERELVSLVGANGAGKTTTISAVSNLVRIKRGRITFNDEQIENLNSHARVARGIVHVPEGRKLFPDMTVIDNLEMGAYHREARLKVKSSMDYVFDIFPALASRRHQLAGTMSGGEQQMLAIGRGLMSLPKLLMIDELSLGLSPVLVKRIFEVVKKINAEGTTILLVEQNVRISLSISTRTYIIREGRNFLEGLSRELINNEEIQRAYLGTLPGGGK